MAFSSTDSVNPIPKWYKLTRVGKHNRFLSTLIVRGCGVVPRWEMDEYGDDLGLHVPKDTTLRHEVERAFDQSPFAFEHKITARDLYKTWPVVFV